MLIVRALVKLHLQCKMYTDTIIELERTLLEKKTDTTTTTKTKKKLIKGFIDLEIYFDL